MPNRILREGILTSERIDALTSWASETFYRRLMSIVDDFGRYYANPSLLRAACFPLKLDKVSNADVEKWLADCAGAALVSTYEVDGKRYLQLLDFRQQERAKTSKFPHPPADAQQVRSKRAADDKRTRTKTEAEAKTVSKEPDGSSVSTGNLELSPPTNPPSATNGDTPTKAVWEAYSAAYKGRYGAAPVRNSRVNGQLANFVKRLGAEEAPRVAAFYLTHGHRRYVEAMHPVNLMVQFAETLRTEWATGAPIADSGRESIAEKNRRAAAEFVRAGAEEAS